MALLGALSLLEVLAPSTASADEFTWVHSCPGPILEGNSGNMGVGIDMEGLSSVSIAFSTKAATAGNSDYTEYRNRRFTFARSPGQVPVQTKEDNLVEGDETFRIQWYDNEDDEWSGCDVTIIDDESPYVTGIRMVSSPAKGDTYGVGEVMEFAATFNEQVNVSGGVLMGVYIGDRWDGAWYKRGSGTDTLVFGYEVKPQDRDNDGISVHNGYVDRNGRQHGYGGDGSITARDSSNARASAWYTGIPNQPGHKVDGSMAPFVMGMKVVSTPAARGVYGTGEDLVIDVTFSAAVRAINRSGQGPFLIPTWSEGVDTSGGGTALYKSGSGTRTLRFAYTVRPGDYDEDGYGFSIGQVGPTGMGQGRIKLLNHDVDPDHSYEGLWAGFDHRLGGQALVEAIRITSSPANEIAYREGESINIDMTFNYPVVVATGTPELLFEIGTEENYRYRDAIYGKGSGTNVLTFTYKVKLGELDLDGITISNRGAYGRQEGKILAARTDKEVEAIQLFPQQSKIAGQKVDGRDYVEAVRITSSPKEGDTYGTGEVITVALQFIDRVGIQGTGHRIRLQISPRTPEDSGIKEARYDSGNYTDTLVFRYKIQEGDRDTDGISIVPGSEDYGFGPGGQFITSANASPWVDPKYPGLDNAAGHKLDAPDLTAPTVSSLAVTSDPGDDDTYGAGDSIEVTVTFNEHVTVTGAPQLDLDLAGAARTAVFKRVSGKAAVFSYTVAVGDADADGIGIGENKLSLNGGTIQDGAEHDADLSHAALAADVGHKVWAPGGL